MKIIINKKFCETPSRLFRQCNYFENYDHRTGKISYIRKLYHTFYPRFHAYVMEQSDQRLVIDFHFDAKKETYQAQGVRAHSGEYSSDIVQAEAERIFQIIDPLGEILENVPANQNNLAIKTKQEIVLPKNDLLINYDQAQKKSWIGWLKKLFN